MSTLFNVDHLIVEVIEEVGRVAEGIYSIVKEFLKGAFYFTSLGIGSEGVLQFELRGSFEFGWGFGRWRGGFGQWNGIDCYRGQYIIDHLEQFQVARTQLDDDDCLIAIIDAKQKILPHYRKEVFSFKSVEDRKTKVIYKLGEYHIPWDYFVIFLITQLIKQQFWRVKSFSEDFFHKFWK